MSLITLSRLASRAAMVALVLLFVFGGFFVMRIRQTQHDLAALATLQANAQDIADGARAIADVGADPGVLRAFEQDAKTVAEEIRRLESIAPSANVAARTIDILVRDAQRIARAKSPPGTADNILVPSAEMSARLRFTIEAHGTAMHATLREAAATALEQTFKTNKAIVAIGIAIVALLLLAVFTLAILGHRRIGIPLQGLLETIREIQIGHLKTAPDPGQQDEVGEVIVAFNTLVKEGQLLEARIDRQERTAMMAGTIARFGGWRYDIATETLEWSSETARIFDEEPGYQPQLDTALSYFEEEGRARLSALFEACLKDGTPYDEVFQMRTKTGRLLWTRSVGHPLRDEDGHITGAYGAFQDITELQESRLGEEQQLKVAAEAQKHESLGKLTGGVAHDFNNLLAVILANLELLREDEGDKERLRMIDGAIGATKRGADLTRNMLAFARRAPLEPQVLDLNTVVQSTRDLAVRTLPSSVRIEMSLLGELWQIEADPASTESALLNLIVNANDAMGGKGQLTIETTNMRIEDDYILQRAENIPPGRYVMLSVSDTGPGIPEQIVDRIFEPFFSTKGPESGSGLGLSMVQGFLKQTGGMVRVYSEPGVGTTFKLFFPAINVGHTLARNEVETPPAPGDGQRVLLVEDEEPVLIALAKILERGGYDVVKASSGDRALEVYNEDGGIDVVVTDIVMPGTLQGPSLIRALRAERSNLPVVFMSGYASEATVHGNGLRPTDIRLMKPVQRSELLGAISRALAGQGTPPK